MHGMKLIRLLVFYNLVAVFCAAALLAACQDSRSESRFAEMSQATMILDSRGPGTSRTPPGWEGGGTPEGVGRLGGHYYYIRNREAIRLYQPQRFAQGVNYDGHGKLIMPDGNIVRVSEGEMVTFAGEHLVVPLGTNFPRTHADAASGGGFATALIGM